jgi:hypothetical protein
MHSLKVRVHDALMRWRPAYRRPLLRALDLVRLRRAVLSSDNARRILLDKDDPPYSRILDSRPHAVNTGSELELHMLLCERDVLRSIWALKSFLHLGRLDPRVVIHDDGSLSGESRDALRSHFVGCEIPENALERASELLSAHPACRFFRRKHPISGKLLDVLLFSRGRYVVVMDSDVLWFRDSPDVTACVESRRPFYVAGGAEAYVRNRRFMEEELDLHPAPNVNSGIVGFRRADFADLGFLEEALTRLVNVPRERLAASLGYRDWPPQGGYDPDDPVESMVWWVMEQTLYALLLGRSPDVVALPRRAGRTGTGHQFALAPIERTTALQHFISDARWNAFFPVGVHKLIDAGFLEAWERGRPSPRVTGSDRSAGGASPAAP